MARKARRRANSDNNVSNGGESLPGGLSGEAVGQQRQEEAEAAKRKRQQNEAFSAWAREKDKILRARRRQVIIHPDANAETRLMAIIRVGETCASRLFNCFNRLSL